MPEEIYIIIEPTNSSIAITPREEITLEFSPGQGTPSFASITGDPEDNAALVAYVESAAPVVSRPSTEILVGTGASYSSYSNFTFDGTKGNINGLTIGRGGTGASNTNTAFGKDASNVL